MCKHVAAVLYGVGARLDEQPELFFQLRNVDHSELITAAGTATAVARTLIPDKVLKSDNLSGIFGIDLDSEPKQPIEATSAAKPIVEAVSKKPKIKKAVKAKPQKKIKKTSVTLSARRMKNGMRASLGGGRS
jgi:uncharacterized Zn finger protein